MKKLGYFIVCLTIVGISGCDILLGPNTPLGKGTLSIGFGDGGGGRSARSLIDDETLAALRYDLVLSGPDNQTITVSLAAGKTFKEQVALGEWRIEAEAYNDDNVLFGKGMTTVRVRAGANEAEVPMTVVVPEDTPVSDLDLTSRVTVPVNGTAPDTTPIDTDEYTGSIAWYDEDGTPFNGTFAAATVYQAVVSLEAKSGYIFSGLVPGSFSYDGADSVTFEVESETTITVRIIFPETGAATPNSYTVIFRLNDGTDAVHEVKTVTAPATTVTELPADPSRPGYTFDGWNTWADGFGESFTELTPVSTSITVYAQWTDNSPSPPVITLNPDAGDGTFTQDTFTVSKGGGAGSQTVSITGSDYTNPRWFVDGDLKGTGTDITINAADYRPGSHNLTLLVNKSGVSWSREISFTVVSGTLSTVVFRTNDGTGAIYALRTVTTGNAIADDFPGAPVRDGYEFFGWNTQDSGGGAAFDNTSPVSGDTTVYAKWNGNTYKVTFMRNYSETDSDTVGSPVSVTVPAKTIAPEYFPIAPVQPSYNFAGWNTEPDGSGAAFGLLTEVYGDRTVYAQWTHDQFTISLNPDAGDGAFSEPEFTISKGGGTGSRTVSITGSGYTNPRWFVDGDLKGTGTDITINAADYRTGGHNLTLLASKSGVSWSKELPFTVVSGTLRTIVFRTNDGTGAIYAVRTATEGYAIDSFPGDPGRDEYTFDGWNTLPGGGGSPFDDTTTITGTDPTITVYAQWTGKTYTVTFMRNYDGTDSNTVGYPATVKVPAKTIATVDFPGDPSRTDYNFAGWNTLPDGSGAAFGLLTEVHGDRTVYAQWTHEQFAISLNADAGDGAFSQTEFTISGGGSQTVSLTGDYTNPRWFVDGDLKGTGPSITIQAADYRAGGHNLTLLISKNGVSWSKEILFTVTN